MDKEAIIDQIKDKEDQPMIAVLSDQRSVIGEVIDEDNHCHYVIKDSKGELTIEDSESVEVSETIIISNPTINLRKNLIIEKVDKKA